MKPIVIFLVGLHALLETCAVNPCLDPTNADYSCELNEDGELSLYSCDITDDDVDDIALCMDDLGRENIIELYLWPNSLTTLPEGIFADLTALETLNLSDNKLTTLPEGIFGDLTALETLWLSTNALTTLPEGIFADLTALEELLLSGNNLTTLPEGIFADLTALNWLSLTSNNLTTLPEGIFADLTALNRLLLSYNALTTLPEGIFGDLTALETLYLSYNALTTLPEGIFGDLTALENLYLTGNALGCLPFIPTALEGFNGLEVDPYGDECGCSTADVTNVCGEETCTPGEFGYTCGTAPVPAPTPEPIVETETPASTTPAPSSSAPGPAASDNTPIVAGVVSAVAGAALIALGVFIFLKRRRAAKQKSDQPPAVPPGHDDGNLEQGGNRPQGFERPRTSAVLDVGNRDERDADGNGGGDINPKSAPALPARPPALPARPPALPARPVQSSTEHGKHATTAGDGDSAILAVSDRNGKSPADQDSASPHRHTPAEAGDIMPPSAPAFDGAGLAGEKDAAVGSADKSLTATSFTATASTANMSTTDQEEVSEYRQRQHEADAASVAGEPKPDGEAASRQSSASDIGLGQAVLAAAQELARSCQILGVSEAAGAVCIMANLFSDRRENDKTSASRLRQCRSMVLALKRADKVVAQGGDTIGEAARVLIEDVHDAIFDLVELIKTFKAKNKLSKLFLSTLFKRRQDELDAVVDRAIMRLQLGLQLQAGHDMSSMKDDVRAVKEGMHLHSQGSTAAATSESVAEARRIRRQRKLDRVEIPEEHLFITSDVLGKGGFGEVYLADYNGHNAAAKVLHIAHDLGALAENQQRRETDQRRAFLRELEAMIRLRSLNTVNVFGAVTSLPDRMVLVMELMPNGDLRTLLKNSEQPLPEEQVRQLIGDICAGMAFLHSKKTVHGDLKSANVLLDGAGRAKIGDFGTSRWSNHTNSTGLATYTKAGQNTQMSLAWSAPEVLDAPGSTYASDVYSFGIVAWEVLSRELPWASVAHPREVYIYVVLKSLRPDIPVDAPADLVNMIKACWAGEPDARPTFSRIVERFESCG